MEQLRAHIKKNNHHIISLIAIIIAFTVPLFFMENEQTGLWISLDAFEDGTYTNTTLSLGHIQLDNSRSGTYLSNILEAEDGSEWDNLSWEGKLSEDPEGASLSMSFDDTLEDLSGNGNNGAGNADYIQGKIGKSLSLHENHITVPNPKYSNDNSGTVSLWISASSLNESTFFYTGSSGTNNNYIKLGIDSEGKLAAEIKSDKKLLSLKGTTAIPMNEWTHIAFTSGPNGNNIYVNAENYQANYNKGDNRTHAWLNNISGANATIIGAFAKKEYNEHFTGDVDELKIWNRALTQEEVQELYKKGILGLSVSVRVCGNSLCDGANWGNETSSSTIDLENSRYVQYKFRFSTDDAAYTPELHNVTINSAAVEKPIAKGAALGNITTELNLSLIVNGSETLNNLTGEKDIILYENSTPLVTFSHNFSISNLNLSRIEIDKSEDHILLRTSGELQAAKTIYLKNNAFDKLCLKDAEINSVREISSACTGLDETDLTSCLANTNGIMIGSYYCKQENGIIEVSNVTHSALRGAKTITEDPAPDATPSNSGSGGGSSRSNKITQPEEKKKNPESPLKKEQTAETKQEKILEKVEARANEHPKITVATTKRKIDSRKVASTAALLLLGSVAGIALFRRHKI